MNDTGSGFTGDRFTDGEKAPAVNALREAVRINRVQLMVILNIVVEMRIGSFAAKLFACFLVSSVVKGVWLQA